MDIDKLIVEYPAIQNMLNDEEMLWLNPKVGEDKKLPFGIADIDEAEERLARFAPYIQKVFPETESNNGLIESPLNEVGKMKSLLESEWNLEIPGRMFIKCDSHLPVSGSIKARGGIYEILKLAEKIAVENGMLDYNDNYEILDDARFKTLFSGYSVAVGSTGNLGLSIGIISAQLGFRVTVHMSADARQWKKDLLRQKGVTVVEYPDDYQKAVAEGRKEAQMDPMCHFVDDESSEDLFMGYAVAAKRLKEQFKRQLVECDETHPVFVYIPCGVGGAPGGVTFGLKQILGDNVHCFFAEPTHAPCMTLGLMTGLHDKISVNDVGLDGKTAADGLAVSRPSGLVSSIMDSLLDGAFTINDKKLYQFLAKLADSEGIYVEPSACAAFTGPYHILSSEGYLIKNNLKDYMDNATHIIWATGGNMVPENEMDAYYRMGK